MFLAKQVLTLSITRFNLFLVKKECITVISLKQLVKSFNLFLVKKEPDWKAKTKALTKFQSISS